MSYRDILVQIDETAESKARAAVASALAVRSQAFLSGVFLKSYFLHNYMPGEAVVFLSPTDIEALLQGHDAAVTKAAEAARATFEAAAGEAGVVSDWRVIGGDTDDALLACARRSDLTILPPAVDVSFGRHRITAGGLGLAAGGPVLVVPPDSAGAAIGKRVLIAWNGSRESGRALRDAWPLVRSAEQVHVLVVSPHGEGGPDGQLQRHLEHHGCKAELIVDRSDDASAADILRRQVAALGADLVVMGLYGRSRLQELVLGGVSRDLMRDPPAALFLSH